MEYSGDDLVVSVRRTALESQSPSDNGRVHAGTDGHATNDPTRIRRPGSRQPAAGSRQLKAQIIAECDAPGASVAKAAMSHGVNAGVVHGWRQRAREGAAVV